MKIKVMATRTGKTPVRCASRLPDGVRMNFRGGNGYINSYDVFYEDSFIGRLEYHWRGNEYFVAWHRIGDYVGPNAKWETEDFDTQEQAVDWLMSFIDSGAVESSTKTAKRPIKAAEFGSLSLSHEHDYDEKYSEPAKRVEMTFPYFLQDIEDSVKEDSYDFSVNGTTLYDNDDYIELEVIPTYAGSQLDTERVVIRFDANESPSFVAEYDNGDQFASGDSFSSILVEVTQSIRESLVEYANSYDELYEEE